MWGRYSHVAAAMERQVLLVAGGYSGVARGDLVAYKVPLFVSSDEGDRVSVRRQGNRKSCLFGKTVKRLMGERMRKLC